MDQTYDQEPLSISDLRRATNRQMEQVGDTFAVPPTPFTKRAIYYYTKEGILPRVSGSRAKGERYPRSFIYRLMFVRRLQQALPGSVRKSLSRIISGPDASEEVDTATLSNIAQILDNLTADRIRAIALGEEPLEVQPAAARSIASHMQLRMADEPERPLHAAPGGSRRTRTEEDEWQTAFDGTAARIQVRRKLTRHQKEEINALGRLLERALEEDQP
jgi:hypothetical protein